jgi:hypothetical protein
MLKERLVTAFGGAGMLMEKLLIAGFVITPLVLLQWETSVWFVISAVTGVVISALAICFIRDSVRNSTPTRTLASR